MSWAEEAVLESVINSNPIDLYTENNGYKIGTVRKRIMFENFEELTFNCTALPYGFYNGSAVVYNDEIHILGSGASVSSTKHYKFDGTKWTQVSTLPYNFYVGSAVVYNNEIHILGGSSGITNHYKFNGVEWTQVSTLPYTFYSGSAVVYNDEIHILGSSYNDNTAVQHVKYIYIKSTLLDILNRYGKLKEIYTL